MTEFNVGDRVRFVVDYGQAVPGDEGVIRSHGGDYPLEDRLHYIDLDNGHHIDGVFPSRFELVETEVEELTFDSLKPGDRLRLNAITDPDYNWWHSYYPAGSIITLTQGSLEQHAVPQVDGGYVYGLDDVLPWLERVTNNDEKEDAVSESKWSDEALEIARKAAKAAEDNNYCAEYDRIATASGLPTRAELKELDGPKRQRFTFAYGGEGLAPVVYVNNAWYYVRDSATLDRVSDSDAYTERRIADGELKIAYEGQDH